jgi:hypothetical protein
MAARLRAFLDNPLSGLAPWIVMSVTSGILPFEVAVGLSLAAAAAILVANTLTDGSQKALEYSDTAYFLILGIVGLFANDDVQDWLRLWAAELSNIALVVIVVGTIVARRPFTLPYARERVPREIWSTPRFIRTNYVISWAWAAAFLVAAAAGFYGDAVLEDSDELWTGWIIPTAAMLCAVQFTLWYPRVMIARAALAQGRPSDPPPPVSELLAAMVGYLPLAGILVLAFDAAGPWWLGVGLIVAGPVIAGRIARDRRAEETPSRA